MVDRPRAFAAQHLSSKDLRVIVAVDDDVAILRILDVDFDHPVAMVDGFFQGADGVFGLLAVDDTTAVGD